MSEICKLKIVISGSMRFKEFMKRLAVSLRKKGFEIVEPNDVPYQMSEDPIDQAKNKVFYEKSIKECDFVLVFNGQGYIGISTAMEIQFALCNDKPAVFMFPSENIETKALIVSKKHNVRLDTGWQESLDLNEFEIVMLNESL